MATQPLISGANKQAGGAKKVECRMQQICDKSPLTKPLERDYYRALKKSIAKATDLQQISIGTYPCMPLWLPSGFGMTHSPEIRGRAKSISYAVLRRRRMAHF